MIHLQSPALNWPQCLQHLASGTVNKFFQTEACSEAKSIRPDCKTIKRYHVEHQNEFLDAPDKEEAARVFFSRFVDGTFRQHAPNIDYIESLNEIYAPDAATQAKAMAWDIAALKVWKTEYRIDPAYQHIKLIAANIAVGNDAPVAVAAACVQYDGVMGYHPYVPVKGKVILPGEYPYYSGRWEVLDAKYKAAGHSVKWMFTESGAVGYSTPGVHLNGENGWKHADVYNGDFEAWLGMWSYWLAKVKAWNSANGNRVLGWQVFTSNQDPNTEWKWFELQQPQMNSLAVFFKTFVPAPPTIPPSPLPGLRLAPPFHEPFIVSSPFDAPREYGKHEGADYVATSQQGNELIHCGYDGTVDIVAYSATGYGKYIRVKHVRNGGTFYTYYCHLDTQLVAVGNTVKAGDPLGEVGSTGNSTGPHVHITLRVPNYGASGYVVPDVVNPDPYIDRWSTPPRRYNRTCHLLPQDATPAEYDRVTSEAYALRQSVLQSIDDALITHPNLTGRKVYVWGDVSRHGAFTDVASFENWVVANYPPLPELIYRSF